jgi:hypothetical protein
MAQIVFKSICLCSSIALASLALPRLSLAQSGGWGEPIAAPRKPEQAPAVVAPEAEPVVQPTPKTTAAPEKATNPDWSDAPPTEDEARSRSNPDWVDEVEAPPIGKMKDRASEVYGIRYANRNLTMPRGMVRGTFDTVVGRRTANPQGTDEPFGPTGTISSMNFGAAISLAKDFEIGFSRYRMASFPSVSVYPGFGFGDEGLISFSMSPEVKFGDIPLYLRFEALSSDKVKLGFDAVFRIPVRTEFGFLGGIPMRFIIQEQFAFDTALEFTIDSNPQGPSVWSINIPFTLVANATDQLFFKLSSGMNLFDLSQTIKTATSGLLNGPFYFIPLGATVGYTVPAKSTMMDIFASFRFPALYGFTTRASAVTTETWQVTIGFNIYSPVLFKGRAGL